ncbi:MAG TPA: dienelactone hydrolase family protein [Pyrinomonadaceae bacterium]|nr:dienelactone hydrolase family protein [Pyrinomonadaceae bacterium]
MCIEDDCPEDISSRRSFLSGATATLASFALLNVADTNAQTQNAPTRVLDNPSIQHGRVVFKHNGVETIDGFLARPKADGVYPSVLVIAGNRITEEYIPNTCAALAVAGFVGLAPNIFHILPDTTRTLPEMRAAGANHTDFDVLEDLDIAADYLRQQSFVKTDTMGVLGFCYGGKMAMLYGARSRQIDAVVPFHPGVTKAIEVKRLKVPVQIHHGTADQAVALAESQRLVKELKTQGTPVELFTYEGAGHGFLAYTRPTYNAEAAKLAWRRAVPFLHKYLGS